MEILVVLAVLGSEKQSQTNPIKANII